MTNEEVLAEAHGAIERLCQQVPLLPVRPLVVDSDVLLQNLMRDAKASKPPTKLLVQGGIGSIRPYVAPHQLGEIRRHLARVAADTGTDPERARQVFEQRYVPILWSADVPGGVGADLLAHVSLVDQADVPTARLAVLLGVRVVTVNRRHFGDLAIRDKWLTVVGAYASVSLLDGTNAGIVVSARVSGEGAQAAGRALRGGCEYLADHPKAALVAAFILLAILIGGVWYLSDEQRRLRAWDTVKRVGPPPARFAGRALQGYVELAGLAVEADAVILASKLPRQDLTLDQRLAEYLASQRFPVPLATMTDGISPPARRLIASTLRDNPAFVEQETGWTFGRPCLTAA